MLIDRKTAEDRGSLSTVQACLPRRLSTVQACLPRRHEALVPSERPVPGAKDLTLRTRLTSGAGQGNNNLPRDTGLRAG